MTATQNPDLYATVLRLAERPNGVRACDVVDWPTKMVSSVIGRLIDAGKLHRAKMGHKTVHYFTSRARADEFLRTTCRPGSAFSVRTAPPRRHAPWPDDAPAHFPRDENGRPLWKTTVAETHPPPLKTNTHGRVG